MLDTGRNKYRTTLLVLWLCKPTKFNTENGKKNLWMSWEIKLRNKINSDNLLKQPSVNRLVFISHNKYESSVKCWKSRWASGEITLPVLSSYITSILKYGGSLKKKIPRLDLAHFSQATASILSWQMQMFCVCFVFLITNPRNYCFLKAKRTSFLLPYHHEWF